MSALAGRASAAATKAFAERFASALAPDFFGLASGLSLASIGLGTYLGEEDAETDERYEAAIAAALEGGINHLDTAVNYRSMASERCVGRALARAVKAGLPREAVLVATKGGYLPHDGRNPANGGRALVDRLIREKKIAPSDVAKGSHCLAPPYMETMLATSLANLGLASVDVYYLHNPEAQLSAGVPRDEFVARCRGAFQVLEAARKRGEVGAYGTATWNGYRRPIGAGDALELERLVEAARSVGGPDHGFRWVQLPINLTATEAFTKKTQSVNREPVTLVEAARRLGVNVIASGSIAQAELAFWLPRKADRTEWPPSMTMAARALHFVRSVPGVATALVGMSQAGHVKENLSAARLARLSPAAVAEVAS